MGDTNYYRKREPIMATLTAPDIYERTIDALWDSARLIAWDGCHKMYVAMDDAEAAWFRDNYPEVVENDDPEVLAATLVEWWNASCALRFISGVSHNAENPNAGFTDLIPQGAEWDDDEDDEDE
jgi:hypothetical protein